MRLVCPSCGAISSREGWENDVAARQYDEIFRMLPHRLQQHTSHYIGLFRKGDRGLAWKRALRLIREVKDLVGAGTVQWDGGEVRPAPVELWAEVMEYMVDTGKRGLENHNYLKKVVWERARGNAARVEQTRELDRQGGRQGGSNPHQPYLARMDGEKISGEDKSEIPATTDEVAKVKEALRGFLDQG